MNVVVILGSPRKKDSYKVCKMLEQYTSLNSDINFEYIFLKDYRIEECKGCDQCFQKGEHVCPCKDDLPTIKNKLQQADGIILSSPVYAYQVTSRTKCFIDRLSYLFHRPELIGKPALTVVTTGGGGGREVSKYLKMTAVGWGCQLIGQICITSSLFFEEYKNAPAWGYSPKYFQKMHKEIQSYATKFRTEIVSPSNHTPSYYDIYLFEGLKSKTITSKADYEFWEKHGWLEENYYYNVKLSIGKLLFGKLIRAMIAQIVKKGNNS